MLVVESSKLNLPNPSLSPSSPQISSLLFEPNSSSLALILSDSSISLYPSLCPLSRSSSSPLSFPQTLIPSPSSSSTFLLLQTQNANPTPDSASGSPPRVLFIVAGPHGGGSRVLLRFYALRKDSKGFVRAQVICNQKGIEFDRRSGVLLNVTHGISVKITGSINYFVMHSVSSSKIFVFGVKLMDGGDDDRLVTLKLMRCAVIECCRPVWSMNVSSGFLVLGEDNGVRVLNLRELVKGKVKKVKNKVNLNEKLDSKRFRSLNGFIRDDVSHGGLSCNGYLDEKNEKHVVPVKQRTSKHRQESSETPSCFVPFKTKELDDAKSKTYQIVSIKAISVQALSPKSFFILDSFGDLHALHVCGPSLGSNITCCMRQLPRFMEVQKLVVLPEISVGMRTFWISDGNHSVHMVTICGEDAAVNVKDEDKSEETLMQVSVSQVIFAAERIQDIAPIARNGILILGLGHPLGSSNWITYLSLSWFLDHLSICFTLKRCLQVLWVQCSLLC